MVSFIETEPQDNILISKSRSVTFLDKLKLPIEIE